LASKETSSAAFSFVKLFLPAVAPLTISLCKVKDVFIQYSPKQNNQIFEDVFYISYKYKHRSISYNETNMHTHVLHTRNKAHTCSPSNFHFLFLTLCLVSLLLREDSLLTSGSCVCLVF